jgi:hypothetical protein
MSLQLHEDTKNTEVTKSRRRLSCLFVPFVLFILFVPFVI